MSILFYLITGVLMLLVLNSANNALEYGDMASFFQWLTVLVFMGFIMCGGQLTSLLYEKQKERYDRILAGGQKGTGGSVSKSGNNSV